MTKKQQGAGGQPAPGEESAQERPPLGTEFVRGLDAQVRFKQLKKAGIVENHDQLKVLVEQFGFPEGRWSSPNIRTFTVAEVNEWLKTRPKERPASLEPGERLADLKQRLADEGKRPETRPTEQPASSGQGCVRKRTPLAERKRDDAEVAS
jgi:hypothetical protein